MYLNSYTDAPTRLISTWRTSGYTDENILRTLAMPALTCILIFSLFIFVPAARPQAMRI
jgi:hypothetical protein